MIAPVKLPPKGSVTLTADVVPTLERDPFNWTDEELKDAIRTAREWLFPMEGEE